MNIDHARFELHIAVAEILKVPAARGDDIPKRHAVVAARADWVRLVSESATDWPGDPRRAPDWAARLRAHIAGDPDCSTSRYEHLAEQVPT